MSYELPGGVGLDPLETWEPDEAAHVSDILNTMRRMQVRNWGDKRQLRAAHAKTHALVQANVEVNADVPEAVRHGLFAQAGRYQGWMRLSSTPELPLPDELPNVRGAALKLLDVPGEMLLTDTPEVDWTFITCPFLIFGTVQGFKDWVVLHLDGRDLEWFEGKDWHTRLWEAVKTVSLQGNLLGQHFYGATPIKVGPHAAKLLLEPETDVSSELPSTNHLRDVTVKWLREHDARFALRVQIQTDPKTQPIEDASVDWGDDWITVGTVTVPAQEVDTRARDERARLIRYNPWQTRTDHRPLGGINRARGSVYWTLSNERLASQKGRGDVHRLPQDDPSPDFRAASLREQADGYTLDRTALPGLGIVHGTPEQDDPSMSWFVTASKVTSPIVLNALANRAAHTWNPAPKIEHALMKRFFDGVQDLEERAIDPENHPRSAPALKVIRHHVDDAVQHLMSGGESTGLTVFEVGTPLNLYKHEDNWPAAKDMSDYEALYRDIPLTPAARDLDDNQLFARRRLTGPNGAYLQRITELPEHFPVTDDFVKNANGRRDSLEAALAEGRLFLGDYTGLVDALEVVEEKGGVRMTAYAPLALFAVPPGGGELTPVAVQCGADPSVHPVVGPQHNWMWKIARTVVEIADMCFYEPITHLALTHLMLEPVAMATRMHLAPLHPLTPLLSAHIEGTIAVNDNAVQHLLADGGAIDQTFGATMESIRRMAVQAIGSHDFRGTTLGGTFAAKGLDADVLPDHPYRDDSLRIHGAMHNWVSAYVRHVYPSDAVLQADPELAAWVRALQHKPIDGGLNGFGEVKRVDDLIFVLTKLLHTASAGHAAVNFPQWTDSGFAPRMSGAGYAPVPTGPAALQATQADYWAMLPPLQKAELHGEFLSLLGGVYYGHLGQYEEPEYPHGGLFRDPKVVHELLPAFRAELLTLEGQIEADNASGRRAAAYTHLLPSKIPQSINV